MASNKYNPYDDVQKIYNYKLQYDAGKKKRDGGDQQGELDMTNAANSAALIRKRMAENGYRDMATQLEGYNAEQTKQFLDSFPVNNIPDNVFPHSTSSESVETLLGVQFNDRVGNNAKRDELWTEAKANPFDTDVGKAIMGEYKLKAIQGRDNEVATGAATNGGNIDSFAAANALRQQASLTAMGQQQAIAAQSARINDLRGALGDIVGTQQIENQGTLETIGLQSDIEQKAHDRMLDIAGVTGYVPEEWAIKNNPYFNEDGTLKNVETDYQQIINNANKELETATDPNRIADLHATIRFANQARHYKVNNYDQYKKYANTLGAVAPQSTLARDEVEAANALADKNLDYNQILGLAGLESEENVARYKAYSGGGSGSGSGMTGSQATTALKNGEVNEATIGAYNAAYGTNYTVDNPPAIAYTNLSDDQLEAIKFANKPIEEKVPEYVEKVNEYFRNKRGNDFVALSPNGNGTYTNHLGSKHLIKYVYSDDSLSEEEANTLLYKYFGITERDVNEALR